MEREALSAAGIGRHEGGRADRHGHDAPAARRAWRAALPHYSQFAVEHLLVVPAGVLIAVAWANLWPESYYRLAFALSFVVNDVALAFFFALITKEIVEAMLPDGALHSWRRSSLPVMAAAAATGAAILVFVGFINAVDEAMLYRGWPVPGAVDIAVVYFVARMIFGRHPAVPFLLILAVASNVLGFGFLAAFFPAREVHLLGAIALLAAGMGLASGLRRARVRSFWPYVLGAGSLAWWGLYWGGFHPALALVPIVPFMPHARRDAGLFVDAPAGSRDTLSRFEVWWRYPVQVTLFLFALINAGVMIGAYDRGVWAIPLATLVGKPVGVLAAAGLCVAVGLHLPDRVGWRELIVIGIVASLGLTMALFFAGVSMAPGQMLGEVKMGVIVSLAGVPLAFLAARLLRVGRYGR